MGQNWVLGLKPSYLPQERLGMSIKVINVNHKATHSGSELGFGVKTLISATVLICTLYKLSPCFILLLGCLLYTSPSPRDLSTSRMPSSA